MRTADFLNALRQKHTLQSDYALAKFLGVGATTISSYRVGRSCFDGDMALKVAELLEMPAGYVLACIEEERAERTKRPQVKAAWRKVAETLAPTAAGTHQKRRDSVYYVKPRPSIRPEPRSSLLGLLTRFSPSTTPAGTAFA